MVEDLNLVKEKILEVVRVLSYHGHLRGFGHVSVRIPGTDRFLITGKKETAGRTMAGLTPEDILAVDLKGAKLEGRLELPSEIFIHSCLYKAREEVGAIIHCHPIYSMALGVAGQHVLPLSTAAAFFAPRVPIYDDPNLIDTEERGQKMVQAMVKAFALVLRGHGTVAAGRTLEEAAGLAFCIEDTARIQLMAAPTGPLRPIASNEIDEAFLKMTQAGHGMRSLWLYYQGSTPRS